MSYICFFLYSSFSFLGPLAYCIARIMWRGEKLYKEILVDFIEVSAETGEIFILAICALLWIFSVPIIFPLIAFRFILNKIGYSDRIARR